MVDALRLDVKHALRGFRHRPGFAALALVTLALGIGANVAIFSVVDGVVLRPLPYQDPDRLVRIWPSSLMPNNLEEGLYLEQHARSLSGVAWWTRSLFLLDGDQAEELRGALVDPGHFEVLGAPPELGRGFLPGDALPGAEPVLVMSHSLWQRRYAGDPEMVGQRILVAGTPRTVVGILSPGHQPMEEDWQLWAPLPRDLEGRSGHMPLAINARLATGVDLQTAQAEVRALLTRLWHDRGRSVDRDTVAAISVASFHDWVLGDSGRQLLFLLAAVGLVLLIACINVGNLLLARGASRQQELSVRLAIGAGGGRLLRLLLTESLLLGALGGALGVAVGGAVLRLGVAHLPAQIPRSHEIALDGRILAFAAVVSLLAAILFGLAPAWRPVRGADLRLRSREAASGHAPRLSQTLVAGEVALAVMVTAGAALMVKSLVTLVRVDPGFEAASVVAVKPSPPSARYDRADKILAYYDEVFAAVARLPGVRAVGGIQFLPMTPGGSWASYSPTSQREASQSLPYTSLRVVTPGYFQTLGIPLSGGREFGSEDTAQSAPVIVVNRALADSVWPGESAVGKSLFLGEEEPTEYAVVGVVGDVRQHRLGESPIAEGYLPLSQNPWRRMYVAARVEGDVELAATLLRDAVHSIDRGVSVATVGSVQRVVAATTGDSRFLATLLSSFGFLALMLGAIGIYGVTAHAVVSRRRELGIRMSLGARPGAVLAQTLLSGLLPVGLGMAIGVLGWLVASRWLEAMLYEVSSTDTMALLQVGALLLAVAAAALLIPARRACRVEPMTVLREQ